MCSGSRYEKPRATSARPAAMARKSTECRQSFSKTGIIAAAASGRKTKRSMVFELVMELPLSAHRLPPAANPRSNPILCSVPCILYSVLDPTSMSLARRSILSSLGHPAHEKQQEQKPGHQPRQVHGQQPGVRLPHLLPDPQAEPGGRFNQPVYAALDILEHHAGQPAQEPHALFIDI